MVPEAAFTSYYGKPILNRPTWEPVDIAGYLFLGGLAGAGSAIAAGAHLTGRPGACPHPEMRRDRRRRAVAGRARPRPGPARPGS